MIGADKDAAEEEDNGAALVQIGSRVRETVYSGTSLLQTPLGPK